MQTGSAHRQKPVLATAVMARSSTPGHDAIMGWRGAEPDDCIAPISTAGVKPLQTCECQAIPFSPFATDAMHGTMEKLASQPPIADRKMDGSNAEQGQISAPKDPAAIYALAYHCSGARTGSPRSFKHVRKPILVRAQTCQFLCEFPGFASGFDARQLLCQVCVLDTCA